MKPLHRIPTHYAAQWDPDDRDLSTSEWGFILLLLLGVWGIYWTVIHWVDYFVGDWLVWYVELLSPLMALPFIWLYTRYGHNPLHWWPMVWGHPVQLDQNNADLVLMDSAEIVDSMGGAMRVWCDVRDHGVVYLKFRRRRDAVWFSLFPIFGSQRQKKKKR